jgi:hypothetical protein
MFRDIRIEHLGAVGHMMHIEDPQSIARLAVDFVRTLSARRLLSSG